METHSNSKKFRKTSKLLNTKKGGDGTNTDQDITKKVIPINTLFKFAPKKISEMVDNNTDTNKLSFSLRGRLGSYIGQTKNGKAYGLGVFKYDLIEYKFLWDNNIPIKGVYLNNHNLEHESNKSTIKSFSGIFKKVNDDEIEFVEGTWHFANNNIIKGNYDGHVDIIFANKDIYKGNMIDFSPSGLGKMKYANGDVYEGSFENGLRNGEGKMTYANKDVYEGHWYDKENGIGKLTYANRDVYKGSFKNGLRNGEGKMTYANGDVFEGTWNEGVENGKGKMTYANGDVYEGIFVNGKEQINNKDKTGTIDNNLASSKPGASDDTKSFFGNMYSSYLEPVKSKIGDNLNYVREKVGDNNLKIAGVGAALGTAYLGYKWFKNKKPPSSKRSKNRRSDTISSRSLSSKTRKRSRGRHRRK